MYAFNFSNCSADRGIRLLLKSIRISLKFGLTNNCCTAFHITSVVSRFLEILSSTCKFIKTAKLSITSFTASVGCVNFFKAVISLRCNCDN
jgi:hypothetical protein